MYCIVDVADKVQQTAGSYGIAFGEGGPVSAVWGWVVVSTMTSFVGLAMAEIVSALPSSGGPYFWSSVLGGDRWGPLAAWVTGQCYSPTLRLIAAQGFFWDQCTRWSSNCQWEHMRHTA